MFCGYPLFDTADRLQDQINSPEQYADLKDFLAQVGDHAQQDWQVSAQFLRRHIGTSGSFSRFRGELQRFLNFLWLKRNTSLARATSDDLDAYRHFVVSPPVDWMTVPRGEDKTPPPGSGRQRAFVDRNGIREANPYWRPFVHSTSKTKKATVQAMVAALSVVYKSLVNTHYVSRSPVHEMSKRSTAGGNGAKKESKEGRDRPQAKAPRLTLAQWVHLHDTLVQAADSDAKYETHLFVVVTMKTLYLRVFELAPHGARDEDDFEHEPVMGDFRQHAVENTRYWHLYVHGKGDEERFVPLPEAYLPYLTRYRRFRGLPRLPTPNETYPLVSRGDTNEPYRSKRSLERIVEESLKLAARQYEKSGQADAAAELAQFAKTTHILRHTGASMDIENGRPLRDVSKDLGHRSPAFTESIYIDPDTAQRYTTGFKRPVV